MRPYFRVLIPYKHGAGTNSSIYNPCYVYFEIRWLKENFRESTPCNSKWKSATIFLLLVAMHINGVVSCYMCGCVIIHEQSFKKLVLKLDLLRRRVRAQYRKGFRSMNYWTCFRNKRFSKGTRRMKFKFLDVRWGQQRMHTKHFISLL